MYQTIRTLEDMRTLTADELLAGIPGLKELHDAGDNLPDWASPAALADNDEFAEAAAVERDRQLADHVMGRDR